MDWAPDATPRYIAKYVSAALTHSIMLRGFRGESQNATVARATGALTAMFTAMEAVLPDDFQFIAASYIAQDSNVTVPVSLPTQPTGAVAVASLSKQDKITSLTFAGKSDFGSKARLVAFGQNWTLDTNTGAPQEDFVLLASDASYLSTVINQLNAAGLAAIDNGVITWYPRATIKTNDHWLKKVRNGVV